MNKHPIFKRKIVQIGLAIAIICLGVVGSKILLRTAPIAEKKSPEKSARLVSTETVTAGTHAIHLSGYGVVQAEQQINLQARVSGTVQYLGPKFVPGSIFKKGDVLVQLDRTDYRIELQTAQAALQQAQSNLLTEQGQQAVAQADLKLLGLQVNETEQALILRQPQLQTATARVQSAQATLERAKLNLERTTLRAPFDGIVVSRETSIGAQVSATSNLGVLARNQAYWVNVAIAQTDLKWIRFPNEKQPNGSAVCVGNASSNWSQCHKGHVLSLLGSVQDLGQQAQVLIQVPHTAIENLQPLLLAQYVKVHFDGIELENVFKLSPSFIHGSSVWINQNGTLKIQPVRIAFQSADYVLIDKGLNNGDSVITSNLSSAIDGMAIRTNQSNNVTTKP